MSRKTKGLTLEQHKQLGLRLSCLCLQIKLTSEELSKVVPLNRLAGIRATENGLTRLRSDLEAELLKQFRTGSTIGDDIAELLSIYYPDNSTIKGITSLVASDEKPGGNKT